MPIFVGLILLQKKHHRILTEPYPPTRQIAKAMMEVKSQIKDQMCRKQTIKLQKSFILQVVTLFSAIGICNCRVIWP